MMDKEYIIKFGTFLLDEYVDYKFTYDEQIRLINNNGVSILHYIDDDDILKYVAIKAPWGFKNMYRRVSKSVQLKIVKYDIYNIQYIQYPAISIQRKALESGVDFSLIQNPSEEIIFLAVMKDPKNATHTNIPAELQYIIVKKDPYNIRYINNQDETIQLMLIETCGKDIFEYIQYPTTKVAVAMVTVDPYLIRRFCHIKEAVIAAVKTDPHSISYIYCYDLDVIMEALYTDFNCITDIIYMKDIYKIDLTRIKETDIEFMNNVMMFINICLENKECVIDLMRIFKNKSISDYIFKRNLEIRPMKPKKSARK